MPRREQRSISRERLNTGVGRGRQSKGQSAEKFAKGYEELLTWLGKQKVKAETVHVCMEATEVYSEPVALWLHEAGLLASVVNPNCIKGFGQSDNIRNKNDEIDAGLIARFCEAKRPKAWVPAPKEQRLLKEMSNRVLVLKDMRQQEKNRIEAHSFAGQAELVSGIEEHVTWLDRRIAELENEIDDHIDRNPTLKNDAALMTSIPGIGQTTSAKMLGHLGDL